MTREVLFRAKRCDNEQWITGDLLQGKYHGTYIVDLTDDASYKIERINWVEVYPNTVSQFTGLTDKNGVKILENDVLCYKGYKTPIYGIVNFGEFIADDSEQYIGFYVEWMPNGDGVKWADLRCDIGYWAVDNYTEVIGNRFDNPELLTT